MTSGRDARQRTRRRSPWRVGLALTCTVALAATIWGTARANAPYYAPPEYMSLHALGVQLRLDGSVRPATSPDARYLPGSRVLDPGADADAATRAAAEDMAQRQRDWLASGTLPTQHSDAAASALLDLHTLTFAPGVTVAGFTQSWRYVWPRDSSFVALAFAVSGHAEDAWATFDFLQRVQAEDGSFEARYLPSGIGTPDARPAQSDGPGWVMWALAASLKQIPEAERGVVVRRFEPLITRSTQFLLNQVGATGLPEPSPDFWEKRERTVTLGIAGPTLAGLYAARDLAPASERAWIETRIRTLEVAIEREFGPEYGRYPGTAGRDAATAFLLPPFVPEPLPGATLAWERSIPAMQRPAGGLAPGSTWREQSVSWTPQTALYAWSAAVNGDSRAQDFLDWLLDHRTALGAHSEKVSPQGQAAGVAPLSWTAALVVLAIYALEDAPPEIGPAVVPPTMTP